jgi:hypothetical protein
MRVKWLPGQENPAFQQQLNWENVSAGGFVGA